jgi:hypothetical protein
MFTAILLACSLQGECIGIAGPAVKTKDDCMKSIPVGWLMIEENYPHMIVKDAKCVQWNEGA